MGQGALSKPVVQWWLSLNSSTWGGGDKATATIPVFGAAAPAGASQPPTLANTGVDIGAVATSSATAARKRKVRGSCSHVAQDERKR